MITECEFNEGKKFRLANMRIYLHNKKYYVNILYGTKTIDTLIIDSYYELKEFIKQYESNNQRFN